MTSRFVILCVGTIIAMYANCCVRTQCAEVGRGSVPSNDVADLLDEWEVLKQPLILPGMSGPEAYEPSEPDVISVVIETQVNAVMDLIKVVAPNLDLTEFVAPNAEPNELAQFEQQFTAQLQFILNADLRFVRAVCQPTPEQYKTIKASGDAALKLAAKELAAAQQKQQNFSRPGHQPEAPDPRKTLAQELAKSVAATMSPEKAKRLQLELDKRAASRKRATVINLVSLLDKHLVLTVEQRTQLVEVLNANWKDAWGHQLELFMYDENYLPELPANKVLPLLDKTRQEMFGELLKHPTVDRGFISFEMPFGEFPDDSEDPAASDNADDANGNQEKQDAELKGVAP